MGRRNDRYFGVTPDDPRGPSGSCWGIIWEQWAYRATGSRVAPARPSQGREECPWWAAPVVENRRRWAPCKIGGGQPTATCGSREGGSPLSLEHPRVEGGGGVARFVVVGGGAGLALEGGLLVGGGAVWSAEVPPALLCPSLGQCSSQTPAAHWAFQGLRTDGGGGCSAAGLFARDPPHLHGPHPPPGASFPPQPPPPVPLWQCLNSSYCSSAWPYLPLHTRPAADLSTHTCREGGKAAMGGSTAHCCREL